MRAIVRYHAVVTVVVVTSTSVMIVHIVDGRVDVQLHRLGGTLTVRTVGHKTAANSVE